MPFATRAARGLAAAAFFLLLLAPPSSAQVNPTLALGADAQGFTLEPGQSARATVTVDANAGPLGGTVQLALDGLGTGWTATLEPTSVPAGQGQTATLTVTAPADRATGAAGPFGLTVTGTLATSTGTATDSVAFQTALTAPPTPPPPPDDTPLYVGGAVLVLAALAAGAAWYMVHRRETGIEVKVPAEERQARPGFDAFVPVEVRNTSRRPRTAELHTEQVPTGWAAGTNLTKVELGPGQAESVWLAVRPPLDAQGRATLSLTAKPVEARRTRITIPVPIHVVPDVFPERLGHDLTVPMYHRTDLHEQGSQPAGQPGQGPARGPDKPPRSGS